jgi:hypothetical protein
MPSFNLDILPQPNDETCGSTCLHAIYKYYGEALELDDVISQIPTLETGGTLAVALGSHALEKGYRSIIHTYNLQVFDPTWFHDDTDLLEKLKQQMEEKPDPKLHWASNMYIDFCSKGGEIRMEELDEHLLRSYFDRNVPILAGLNATYLYGTPRELGNDYDDVRGTSSGHFVVLYGYDKENQKVLIADPLLTNPISGSNQYSVTVDHLINSIMLGILTYDANFLVIEKKNNSIGNGNNSGS